MKNILFVTTEHRSRFARQFWTLFTISTISASVISVLSLNTYASSNEINYMSEVPNDISIHSRTSSNNVRDPNAYSAGYTLESAPYSITGKDKLSLADEYSRWYASFERFEYAYREDHELLSYDGRFIWGWDYDKAIFSSEGSIGDSNLIEASSELLWSHAVSAFWNRQIGARYDFGEEKDQAWITAGFQGLAPYWFEVDVKSSVSTHGQIAFDLETEYELFLTQRLILQPRLEVSIYGKDDKERKIASGLSSLEAGLRMRYEYSRQFAPYIGVEWDGQLGDTQNLIKQENGVTQEFFGVAGVRFWF